MLTLIWLLSFLIILSALNYHRAALSIWLISFSLFLAIYTAVSGWHFGSVTSWLIFVAIALPIAFAPIRRKLFTKHILAFYQRVMPAMSKTERDAISAGTVSWEGDLFRGAPNWQTLLSLPTGQLSEEEKSFLDNEVETLCSMIDDWDITHNRADLPPALWQYIKDNGFFGLIIPKSYGGKAFSAFAHSEILTKISGRSITVSSTVAVPNSLGPAELLLHYGTEEQKNYYLPRLAKGLDIPCFALTSPDAGSDAGAMSDYGIVCRGMHAGREVLGITLHFKKRYITLAPIATVIGLAFKLYDPNHLLGDKENIGITCALIPRETPGMIIGRRHFPLNTPFMNGPIEGEGMFIPLDWIIGGTEQAGNGWRMLMECLAAGRAITLPASALGGAKVMCYTAGAYSRIRRQFNMPIGRFEGIEEPLARIATYTYIMDAARTLAAGCIDAGAKPAIASAIVKYHVTELGRKVGFDSMDIHGGKAICLGPSNYLGRSFEASPIGITVEGANILTRNMIIFGQGAIRCHPYVLQELTAAKMSDPNQALKLFDQALMKHMAFAVSNIFRSFILGVTSSHLVTAPSGKTNRYFQHATRFSSAFALIADVCMLSLGGSLKRKESISARLGDILSYLYLLSAVLKHYHDQGEPMDDFPIVRFASDYCLYQIQERFAEILKNFPNRWTARWLRLVIFPAGMQFSLPRDRLNHKIAELMMSPTATRERLSKGAYVAPVTNNVLADVQDALLKTIAAEPLEHIVKLSLREGKISGHTLTELLQSALTHDVITKDQHDLLLQAEEARAKVIAVDDFTTEELARVRPHEHTKTGSYLSRAFDGLF